MTDANKRAIKRTAITVLIIIALFYTISMFPFLGGYLILAFFITTIIGVIYLFFITMENYKDLDKLK